VKYLSGSLMPLAEQDRTRWGGAPIVEGVGSVTTKAHAYAGDGTGTASPTDGAEERQ
jgi:hypothetical protein